MEDWKQELGKEYPRLVQAMSISLLKSRAMLRARCLLLSNRVEGQ